MSFKTLTSTVMPRQLVKEQQTFVESYKEHFEKKESEMYKKQPTS